MTFAIIRIVLLEIINLNVNYTEVFMMKLTQHAQTRMAQRGISFDDISLVLDYGKEMFTKGAIYYILTKKNIVKHQKSEPRLKFKKLSGLRVIVSTRDYSVITAYRSKS